METTSQTPPEGLPPEIFKGRRSSAKPREGLAGKPRRQIGFREATALRHLFNGTAGQSLSQSPVRGFVAGLDLDMNSTPVLFA